MPVPKPEHLPCPLQAAGAQHPPGLMHGGLCTPFEFFPFTPNTRNKQKLTAWKEAGYAPFFFFLFLCCVSPLLFFWLAAKPEAER